MPCLPVSPSLGELRVWCLVERAFCKANRKNLGRSWGSLQEHLEGNSRQLLRHSPRRAAGLSRASRRRAGGQQASFRTRVQWPDDSVSSWAPWRDEVVSTRPCHGTLSAGSNISKSRSPQQSIWWQHSKYRNCKYLWQVR